MERVVLTGATGFIGGFLAEALTDQGYEVFPVVRSGSNTTHISFLKDKFITLDFNSSSQIAQVLNEVKPAFFVHNAGLTRSASQTELDLVNAEYLKNILDGIRISEIQLKKFVFVSSLAAFGPAEFSEEGVVSQRSTPNPLTMYGKSKLKAEQYLSEYSDINHIIIRPTAVYGPREKDLLTVYKVINAGLEIYIGSKSQQLSFIYVTDLVNIIIKAMEYPKVHVAFFATDNKIYSIVEYNKFIKKALKRRTLQLVIPLALFRLMAWWSEKIGKISGKYPALNIDKANELSARSWHCDMQTTIDELGYVPEVHLEDGLSKTIIWCRENEWI